jgi:hypothetical protein
MEPHFLNVDLEIESASKLDLLAAEMGRRVVVLYSGPASKPRRHLLSVECSRHHQDPDATIQALCAVVESLSPAARHIWRAARKEFHVGYELNPAELASRFTLRPDTTARVVKLGAGFAATCYRGEPNDT